MRVQNAGVHWFRFRELDAASGGDAAFHRAQQLLRDAGPGEQGAHPLAALLGQARAQAVVFLRQVQHHAKLLHILGVRV